MEPTVPQGTDAAEGPVLVTGAGGYLGSCVVAVLEARGVSVVTGGRRGAQLVLDLAEPEAAARAVAGAGVARVVHCAAMARAGDCEAQPAWARRVNGEAAGALARAVGGALIFVSTDLVFGGDAAPYRTTDPVAPRSAYGESKAMGEELVLAAGGMVVRVPLLFGPAPSGTAGALDVLEEAVAGRGLLFTDEFRTPLHVADAAVGIGDALERVSGAPAVLHLAGPERVSRATLVERACALRGLQTALLCRAPCPDPSRPRDVSLVGHNPLARSLDGMLGSGT